MSKVLDCIILKKFTVITMQEPDIPDYFLFPYENYNNS